MIPNVGPTGPVVLQQRGGARRSAVTLSSAPPRRMARARLLYLWGVTLAITAAPALAADDGANLLSAIQSAAQHQTYSGTFIYQQGATVQSTRISHVMDASGENEKLELLDGRIREFIRHDDEVRCYVPDRKLVLVESHAKTDQFPALLSAPVADIDANYRVTRVGAERVAGHECNVVSVEPRDALRYGYKLWTDQASGLLLKAETLNENGEVLEQVAFTDVTIGGRIDRARLKPSAASTDGWHVEHFESVPQNLQERGWRVNAQLPGFHQTLEAKRTFGAGREVGQIVFSDGLASVSVFVEPLGGPGEVEGDATKGPINVVRKRLGEFWLTVVGEVPPSTVRQFADSVEFVPPK